MVQIGTENVKCIELPFFSLLEAFCMCEDLWIKTILAYLALICLVVVMSVSLHVDTSYFQGYN